jgi:iron complex outermembrane receptor protein
VGGGELDQESFGAFVSVDYSLGDEITLFGGVRYSDESKNTKIRTRIDNACSWPEKSCPYRPQDAQDDDWQTWSPKVGLSWAPTDELNFYGYYAKGYRSGGFNIRQTGAAVGDPLAPGYDQEEQDAYELGMKSVFNDGDTMLNVALFYSEINGLQKDVALASSGGVLFPQVAANTADATPKGIEIEMKHQINDAFLLSAIYGYIDAEYTDVVYDLNGDGVVDGKDESLELTRTPKNSGAVSLTHEYPFNSGAALVTRLSWAWKSRQFSADNNTIAIPSKEIINLFTTFFSADDVWSVSVYGKNLTDDRVYAVAAVLPENLGSDFSVLEQGLTFGVEVEYNFY